MSYPAIGDRRKVIAWSREPWLLADRDDLTGVAHVDMNMALTLPGVDRRSERLELLTGQVVWQREAFGLQRFGMIDGEMFATSPCCDRLEMYSLE